MAKSQTAEFIRPPNTLKVKVGGDGKIDLDAIARAEKALEALSDQFSDWLAEEVDRLRAARAEIKAKGVSEETMGVLQLAAHDLKGLGTTYNFPMVTEIAGSLCTLLEQAPDRTRVPLGMVDAHVDAIRAVVRDEIRETDHPIGSLLLKELQTNVRTLIDELTG
ncbi:MAG: Hpt domain-containing protein [Alphaproteobacteria bacterium]|nr:Hpt domain-containing protein [Alphaproteobacteria bacterium]